MFHDIKYMNIYKCFMIFKYMNIYKCFMIFKYIIYINVSILKFIYIHIF